MKNEIILFENKNLKLKVNLQDESVWLSSEQMAKLFDTSKRNIEMHIKNIYDEKELEETSTRKDFFQVQIEGNREVKRIKKIYNLDVIISIGYRVKSQNGIIFRKWANKILKDYMLKGYAINQKRLEYLEKTVKLIDIANRNNEISNNDAKDILKVINEYSKALDLLDDYDHKTLIKPKDNIQNKVISYNDCLDVINKLKFNNESKLFALERNEGLKEILGAIYQTFDNKDVYPTTQEKAANFLYMIVKNHIFIDGNKRIAATLFIYFLTLLIAESNPKEKIILIDLIMNFLN